MELRLTTIGSDPEFFIRQKSTKNFIPASIITNGTKDNPESTQKQGFLIHRDNLTVEGNIPPARNKEEFIASMKYLKELINTLAEIKKCELVYTDEAQFKPRFLQSEEAHEFGCSGYNNAWKWYLGSDPIDTPSLEDTNIRVAGFHIHIGYEIDNSELSKEEIDNLIAKAFDLFLTLPSDKIVYSEFRRKYYGEYGSYRNTDYGVECRSLGSYFTQDKYLNWIYDQIEKMFSWLNIKENQQLLLNASFNNGNVTFENLSILAEELCIEEEIYV